MKTANEREEAFRKDLDRLLSKHGAEFSITDDHKPYGMQSGVVVVTMMPTWNDEGSQLTEYTEFNL